MVDSCLLPHLAEMGEQTSAYTSRRASQTKAHFFSFPDTVPENFKRDVPHSFAVRVGKKGDKRSQRIGAACPPLFAQPSSSSFPFACIKTISYIIHLSGSQSTKAGLAASSFFLLRKSLSIYVRQFFLLFYVCPKIFHPGRKKGNGEYLTPIQSSSIQAAKPGKEQYLPGLFSRGEIHSETSEALILHRSSVVRSKSHFRAATSLLPY